MCTLLRGTPAHVIREKLPSQDLGLRTLVAYLHEYYGNGDHKIHNGLAFQKYVM